jgi:hypothetical protein
VEGGEILVRVLQQLMQHMEMPVVLLQQILVGLVVDLVEPVELVILTPMAVLVV